MQKNKIFGNNHIARKPNIDVSSNWNQKVVFQEERSFSLKKKMIYELIGICSKFR